MASPDISSTELDDVLRQHWCQKMTLGEKVKYFTRARDALRDEDKHTKRVGREKRSGKTGSIMAKLDNEMSSLELFTHLKTRRQKDLLTKWLHFFQKVLSRKEYAEFIEEVKQGILEAEAKDKPHKNRGLTSKIFSHKKLLFLKMEKLKDHVMHEYCRRKRREKDFRKLAYQILVSRLIRGKPCAFIKGCRSRKLSRALQDLQDMEYGDSVAVLGYPIETSSFTSLYREIVETVDSCMFRDDLLEKSENSLTVTSNTCTKSSDSTDIASEEASEINGEVKGGGNSPTSSDIVVASEPSNQTAPEDVRTNDVGVENVNCDARNNKTKIEISEDVPTTLRASRESTPECFNRLVNDNAVALILDGLRKVTDLPELNRNTLDAIFLPPPTRLPVFGPMGQPVLHAEKTIPMSSPSTVQGWKSLARPPKIRYEPVPQGRGNNKLSYNTRRNSTALPTSLSLSVPHVPGGRQQMLGAGDITTGVPPGFPVQQMMFPRHSNPDHSKMFPSVSSALPGSLLPVGGGSIYGQQSLGGSMRVHGTNPHASIGRPMQTANGSPMMPSYRHFLPSTVRPPGILHSHLGMYRGSGQIPIGEILHAEARDAFNRSYTSNTDPCCEMDSPSCALSTWVAADNPNQFEKQFD